MRAKHRKGFGDRLKEKFGQDFYKKLGKRGGSRTLEKYGPEYFGALGKQGAIVRQRKYADGQAPGTKKALEEKWYRRGSKNTKEGEE